MAILLHQSLCDRHDPLVQGPLHTLVTEAVDLEHDDAAARIDFFLFQFAPADPLHHAIIEGVVIVDGDQAGDQGVHGREDDGSTQSRPEAVHLKEG